MKKQILVIHGGGSFVGIPRGRLVEELKARKVELNRLRRTHDWKATLQEKLGEGYDVLFPRMPNPDDPRFKEWRAWFDNILSVLDRDLILVGHSLGGLFLLKYFSEQETAKHIAGLFAVAPPYVTLEEKWGNSGFSLPEDFSKLGQIRKVFLYASNDDTVVSYEDGERFAQKIPHASYTLLENRGHFADGNFPEIIDDMRGL